MTSADFSSVFNYRIIACSGLNLNDVARHMGTGSSLPDVKQKPASPLSNKGLIRMVAAALNSEDTIDTDMQSGNMLGAASVSVPFGCLSLRVSSRMNMEIASLHGRDGRVFPSPDRDQPSYFLQRINLGLEFCPWVCYKIT
jgi:hypothetical protein